MKTGLILGKFMPLHLGHEYLINTGLTACDVLHVVVCSLSSEPIDGNLRYEWVKHRFCQEILKGRIVVHHLKEDWMPQEPSDCISEEAFFGCWAGVMESLCNTKFDVMFASEMYIHRMSNQLNCTPILVDLERKNVPISGTMVRDNPIGNWKFINRNVKKYFAKRVLIIGGESTGKSIMTQMLDEYYEDKGYLTYGSQEYARDYIDQVYNGNMEKLTFDDITHFGQSQMRDVDSAIQSGFQIVFSDTDAIVSKVFQQTYYGKTSPELDEVIDKEQWDLVLFLENDVPWVDDGQRNLGEKKQRELFQHKLYVEVYNKKKMRNIVFINGDWEQRFEKAKKSVDKLLQLM
jgi:HTH-type transcriptional repressor of NAD biosynthesis genes